MTKNIKNILNELWPHLEFYAYVIPVPRFQMDMFLGLYQIIKDISLTEQKIFI